MAAASPHSYASMDASHGCILVSFHLHFPELYFVPFLHAQIDAVEANIMLWIIEY